jgi:hypothetical protein
VRTYAGAAARHSDRLAADRAWARWGMAAAVTGMLAWLIGVALIPLDAKLDKGEQHLVQVLRAHTGQLYVAALLAVLGAVLLAAFFAVLTRLVPEGLPRLGSAVRVPGRVRDHPDHGGHRRVVRAGRAARRGRERRRRADRAGLARALADVPGLRSADHRVHGDRGAGAAAGRAVPALGVRPWAGCRRQRTCWCCSLWPSAAPSRRTGSSPGSSRSPPSSGSSPWPPHCRDRGGQPPLPPSKLMGDQGGRAVT